MNPEQIQELIAELQNGDDRQRRAASYKLARAKDSAAARALITAANDPDPSVRSNALEGLRSMVSDDARQFVSAHDARVLAVAPEMPTEPRVPTASSWRRFFNFLIDWVSINVLGVLLVDPLLRLVFGTDFSENLLATFLVAYLEFAAYYFVFELAFQRTPGKFITGTKVIMLDGSRPDASTILKRSLIRWVPFEAVSLYTGKDVDQKGTWWHDRWSGTRVVRQAPS